MKNLILTTNLFLAFSILIYFNGQKFHKEWKNTATNSTKYELDGITNPKDIQLIDDSLFILKDTSLIEWDISLRKVALVQSVPEQTLLDEENKKLFLCSWENFEISSPEEISTNITWRNKGENIREIPIYKTVKPIRCLNDRIIGMNAFPTLEEKYYEIKVEDGSLREVEFKDYFFKNFPKNLEIDNNGKIFIKQNNRNSFLERVGLLIQSIAKNI